MSSLHCLIFLLFSKYFVTEYRHGSYQTRSIPYLFVLELDYVLWKTLEGIKDELRFKLEKQKSRGVSPNVLTNL